MPKDIEKNELVAHWSLLAALKVQGFVQAFGVIALPNPASVRMFESFSAEYIGTQQRVSGHWVDVGYWQLELTPPPDRPVPPMPMSEAFHNADFTAGISSGEALLRG